ncbi:MAG: hypothetical protein GY777_31760 [Candidatus Brocadiaceae bacterium]|nr:hypothetical protein [Candidatus Brocadiaceae bacterium]
MKPCIFHHNFCKSVIPVLILLQFFFHSLGNAQERSIVNAVIPEDVYQELKIFLNNRSPEEVDDFSGNNSRRDVVEPILLAKALAFSAPELIVQFVPIESSHDRRLDLVKRGIYDFTSTTVWSVDLDEKYLSSALIRKGEFTAGIYVSPDNKNALNARSLEDIRQLTFVSSRKWVVDWATLTALSVRNLHHVINWKFMPKMVLLERVDALLAPFQSNDKLILHVEDGNLIPVPGLKIGLKGTRHLAVADKNIGNLNLKEVLNKGITHLRDSGTIKRAYEESGFFNIHVKDWLQINDESQ